MWFIPLLFILLSPGLLLTLPPVNKRIFMSGQTSVIAILVHAFVFTLVLYGIKQYYILNSPDKEAFENYTNTNWRGLVLSGVLFMGLSLGLIIGGMIEPQDSSVGSWNPYLGIGSLVLCFILALGAALGGR